MASSLAQSLMELELDDEADEVSRVEGRHGLGWVEGFVPMRPSSCCLQQLQGTQ